MSSILLVIVAGGFTASALLPMKFTTGWKFENTWLLYALCAYLIAPWIVAIATVPHLSDVYTAAGPSACLFTALFGLGWGLAIVLNGIGVAMIGLSLSSAILMGSSIALGALLPLLLKQPDDLLTKQGLAIMGLALVMLVGVLLCAKAGQMRSGGDAASTTAQSHATRGILICFIAGVLSTLFNGALAYGDAISREAVAHGANTLASSNAIWSLAVSAGSLPSIVLCTARLFRARGWKTFGINLIRNTSLCVLMAILWITGTVIYGAATHLLGTLGAAVAWPIYMSGIILIANLWGWVTGEWRGVRGPPARYMLAGIGVQVIAIIVLGRLHEQ
jgi:L-rhamnose-H+ transport protein